MKGVRHTCGFTLIEFSIVMVLSGILMSGMLQLYSIYLKKTKSSLTYERVTLVKASITSFYGLEKRYPCPADPSLDLSDPAFGLEDCALIPAIVPDGTCNGANCKVAGARDTEADADADPDPVLVGGIPFKTIANRITSSLVSGDRWIKFAALGDIQDGWGQQMTYVVTGYLAQAATFEAAHGAVAIRKEDGGTLVRPENGAHYALVSHGGNWSGAYNIHGKQSVACPAAGTEAENCDGDSTFISGLHSESAGSLYYDDFVSFESYVLSSIWDYSDVAGYEDDIYNLNGGNIGVGLSAPQEKLDVFGNVMADEVHAPQICDSAGTNCFPADILGGPTGIVCPAGSAANTIRLATGIANNNVVCSGDLPLPSGFAGQSCPSGQYMSGVNSMGSIVCQSP